MVLTGCATTIGNRADPAEVQFVLNETHKLEVAETLGLPAKRALVGTREHWGYTAAPTNINAVVMSVPGKSTVREIGEPAKLECKYGYIFNEKGILISSWGPE